MRYFLWAILLFIGTAWQAPTPRQILKNIKAPTFPKRDFVVKTGGDFRQAVQKAVDDCHAAGGGRVVVPAGEYLCNGPIHLKSNVNLHVEKGALVRFGTTPADYLPLVKVRWEGTVCYNYSPLIYAYQQKNIAVTGAGILDGQAAQFWFAWKKQPDGKDQETTKPLIRGMGEKGTPEAERRFGEGFYLRPTLIEFYECENILLDGFTARQSPFWTIHPVFSKNLTIRNLTIKKGTTNDDGIDPDSCEDVLIEHCDIATDDDPISIKAGRDQDAWQRRGTRNVLVRHCTLRSKVGNGVCIGSEMSGGVENVFVENCYITKADHGINFKANLDRGGFIKNVVIRNLKIDSVNRAAVRMQMDYHSYRGGNFPPVFDELHFENILCGYARDYAWQLVGVAAQPIKKVRFKNVKVAQSGKGEKVEWVTDFEK
ncbi:MAG: glycoside hydrolase family 28 protein [Spirosomaceae bacterium]|jgi:polygalacturonase|nr:glycoside hydrolase family 28 protein [Spirosomataceae bacterium]